MISVSIVIPLFNKSQYVITCIQSLVNSAAKINVDYEIIVIDDCSTDDSVCLIEDYKKTVNTIQLIKLDCNGGPSLARNVGIRYSKNDYVYFLDADDFVSPDFFSFLLETIKMFSVARVFAFGICNVPESEGISFFDKVDNYRERPTLHSKYEYHRNLNDGVLAFSASSVCLHKSIFHDIGYFDEKSRYSEDAEFWARISYDNDVVVNKTILVAYRSVSGSLSHTYFHSLDHKPVLLDRLYEQSKFSSNKDVNNAFSIMFLKYLFLSRISKHKSVKELIFTKKFFKESNVKCKILSLVIFILPDFILKVFIRFYIFRKN